MESAHRFWDHLITFWASDFTCSFTWLLMKVGGVYMTPGRLSPRSELTPIPSHGSIFVFNTWSHHKMSCQRESPRREFTPVLEPGREFHSGTKSRNANHRSGSDEKLSAHYDFSPDPKLLTPTESRWGCRSFIDPICCNFCMVLSMLSRFVLANSSFSLRYINLTLWTLAPQKTHGTLDPRHGTLDPRPST